MNVIQRSVQAYQKHHHLKLAAKDVGIPWQTLYTHLKKAGVAVIGDKSRYGTDSDKLASLAEKKFNAIIPFAESMNNHKFQSKIDFMVGEYSIDVKASKSKKYLSYSESKRWSFSVKKQGSFADFFVCFCFSDSDVEKILLIPGELARNYQTISVSLSHSKWSEYEVTEKELHDFFVEMVKIPKA